MWIDLVDLIKLKAGKEAGADRPKVAKSLNALYGSICNCQVAFHQCKAGQDPGGFHDLAHALDAFIYSLHNLNPLLELFEPEIEKGLSRYMQGDQRLLLHAKPRELLKYQLGLLRNTVSRELDEDKQPLDEFSSFTNAVDELSDFIPKTYTINEIFHRAIY